MPFPIAEAHQLIGPTSSPVVPMARPRQGRALWLFAVNDKPPVLPTLSGLVMSYGGFQGRHERGQALAGTRPFRPWTFPAFSPLRQWFAPMRNAVLLKANCWDAIVSWLLGMAHLTTVPCTDVAWCRVNHDAPAGPWFELSARVRRFESDLSHCVLFTGHGGAYGLWSWSSSLFWSLGI